MRRRSGVCGVLPSVAALAPVLQDLLSSECRSAPPLSSTHVVLCHPRKHASEAARKTYERVTTSGTADRPARLPHTIPAPVPGRRQNPIIACSAGCDCCAAHIAALSIGGQDDSAMFGVFDGHGAHQKCVQVCGCQSHICCAQPCATGWLPGAVRIARKARSGSPAFVSVCLLGVQCAGG